MWNGTPSFCSKKPACNDLMYDKACYSDTYKGLTAFLCKEIPTLTLKAYTGSGRIVSLNTWWGLAVNFMAKLVYPKERNPLPLNRRLDGSPEPVWLFWTKSLAPTAIQSMDWTIHSSFSLHQCHYLDGLFEVCCG